MPTIKELIQEQRREQARIEDVIGKLESVLTVMRLWAKELGGDGKPRRKILEMVEVVMREHKAPMQPRTIADRIREKFDVVTNPLSIGTMLNREVTRGKKKRFAKEPGATNTYGLKEWEGK